MKRCPNCGGEALYGPHRREVTLYEDYFVPYECELCKWEGDNPLLAYTEDYGLTPFGEQLEEVLNFLAVGTKEALVNAHRELGRIIND